MQPRTSPPTTPNPHSITPCCRDWQSGIKRRTSPSNHSTPNTNHSLELPRSPVWISYGTHRTWPPNLSMKSPVEPSNTRDDQLAPQLTRGSAARAEPFGYWQIYNLNWDMDCWRRRLGMVISQVCMYGYESGYIGPKPGSRALSRAELGISLGTSRPKL